MATPAILEALLSARMVGGLQTSMQSPDVDLPALRRALAGTAQNTEVLLRLHDGDTPAELTLGDLATSQWRDGAWDLTSGERLWIS